MLHPLFPSDAHCIEQRLAVGFTFLDIFTSAQSGLQYFNHSHPSSAILTRDEPLRNDVAKALGQAVTENVLLGHRENSDDSLHRLRRIDSMQCGEDEVNRFCRRQRYLHACVASQVSVKN